MKKQSGFTLIELMVVMAIIAILATAGLSGYTGYIKKANETKTNAMLAELVIITELFRDTTGQLPIDVADMATRFYNSGGTLSSREAPGLLTWTSSLLIPSVFAAPNPNDVDTLLIPGSQNGCAHYSGSGSEITFDGPCAIFFVKFSDGSYAWGGGIRTKNSLNDAFVLDDGTGYAINLGGGEAFAPILAFRGNNASLNTVNSNENNMVIVSNAILPSGITFTNPQLKSTINTNSIPPTAIW